MNTFRSSVVAFTLLAAGFSSMASAQGGPSQGASDARASMRHEKSALSSKERDFMTKAARGGMVEVELGRIAAKNATRDEVKKFGEKMVADHGRINEDLKQLAKVKLVELPLTVGKSKEQSAARLQKLSGEVFDREYMRMMKDAHEKDVAAFRSEAKSAKDHDLAAFVNKALPTLEEHLLHVTELSKKIS